MFKQVDVTFFSIYCSSCALLSMCSKAFKVSIFQPYIISIFILYIYTYIFCWKYSLVPLSLVSLHCSSCWYSLFFFCSFFIEELCWAEKKSVEVHCGENCEDWLLDFFFFLQRKIFRTKGVQSCLLWFFLQQLWKRTRLDGNWG